MSWTSPTGCPSCNAWAADRTSGHVHAHCDDCKARSVAQSPAAWRAMNAQTNADLQDLILKVFTEDGYKAGRQRVWDWIQRLKEAKSA